MCCHIELPRDQQGSNELASLLDDPEMDGLIWADSVPFWDVADHEGNLQRSLRRSPDGEAGN